MKALAFLLPALAAASPVLPRDDSLGKLQKCGPGHAACPILYECVSIDAACKANCQGYCLPSGLGFPTGTLPTATLITTNDLPTATLSATGLPTTNIFGRGAAARPTNVARRL